MAPDRRTVLKLAVAGGTALATPRFVGAVGAAATRPQVESPGFYRFMLGQFEVTALLDGKRSSPGPYPTFGEDQPAEAVAALMKANFLPADKYVNAFTPVLVNTGTDLVLFDTGLGDAARSSGMGRLRERLAASGYRPEDVTVVALTHFHGDHVGGLMEAGEPAFPKARYAASQAEYDYWSAPERLSGATEANAKATQANVVPLREKFTFLKETSEVTPGITAHEAFGHTPGHMIYRLDSGGRQLMITGDAANHYVASLQKPDWHVRFDGDKEMAAATRKRVFGMLAAERTPFIGYHMPFPGLGFVEPLGNGFRFVPASYQFEL